MTHRIERVPAGAYSAEATINSTARKMRADTVGDTADIVWMNERVAELEMVRTSAGIVTVVRNLWPVVGPWTLADHLGLTTSQADTARREIAERGQDVAPIPV